MRFSLFWMQKTLRLGDRRGSGREIPRAGNPRPSCLQRFCKRNRGAGLYARVRDGWTLLICPNYNGSGAGRQGGKCVFPENFPMRNAGAAGRGSRGREIPHAQRAQAAVPGERRGEGGGSCFYACDAGGASMRLHVGFMMDPTAAAEGRNRFFPFPDAESAEVRRPPLPRAGNSPRAPNAFAAPAETQGAEWADGRSAGPADQMEGRGGVRDRPDAHAHAGHASRTLFANATAAIFLRSLSNADILHCSYIPTQNMPLQLLRRP